MNNLRSVLTIFTISLFLLLASDFFIGHKLLKFYKDKNINKIKDNKILPTKTNDLFKYDFKKNFEGTIHYGVFNYELCTNNLRMRISCENKNDHYDYKFNYIFIGDSFTEGVGLNYNDTFVGIFEQNFPKKKIGNLGISGHSPRNYYSKIKKYILDGLVFEELIVFIDISDISDEAGLKSEQTQDLTTNDVNKQRNKNFKEIFKSNFPLSHYLLYRIKYFNLPKPIYRYLPSYQASSWTYNRSITNYDVEYGIESSLEYMNKLYDFLNQNNIKLSIAIYPWPNQLIYDRADSVQVKIWEDFCKSKCKNFLNYFQIFFDNENTLKLSKAKKIIKKLYLENDMHFNKTGNKMIASNLIKAYR